jgi:hypothetical protein
VEHVCVDVYVLWANKAGSIHSMQYLQANATSEIDLADSIAFGTPYIPIEV